MLSVSPWPAAADTTPVAPFSVDSQRLRRYRLLFAQLDEIAAAPAEAFLSGDLDGDEVCEAIHALNKAVIADPARGIVGLAELSMAVQYWFRPYRGSAWSESDPSSMAVCALLAATFAHCEGGAHG